MKKLLLIIGSSSLLFCTKKEEVKPQSPTASTTKTSSICSGDTTYSFKSKIPFQDCTIKETCTQVTIIYHKVGKTITVQIPEKGQKVSNYPNHAAWLEVTKTTDPHAIWYELYNTTSTLQISFGQEGAGFGAASRLKR